MITPLILPMLVFLGSAQLEVPRMNGSYTLEPGLGDSVPKAVDTAVARMNFLLRPIARRRLEHTNRPAKNLHLFLGPRGHEVRFDARAPILTPAHGQAIHWTREDGERFMVRTTLGTSELIQRFEAPDGAKTNRYQLDAEGHLLRLHVIVESPKLPAPLTYTLVYRKHRP